MLDIDRVKKKFKMSSSKTDYQMKEMPYSELFDNPEEMQKNDRLGNVDFILELDKTFSKIGYTRNNNGST